MQPLWRTVWRFRKKLKTKLAYDAAIPFLGIYQDKTISKDAGTPMFIAALFTTAKTWKEPNIHQQMNGERCGARMLSLFSRVRLFKYISMQRNSTQP